jgi:hypothetical protein
MSVSSVTTVATESASPNVGDLSAAMFIAGARALGLQPNEVIAPEAQEKIIMAATVLVEGLREVLKMTAAGRHDEPELGN